jgi:beta-phosphoglucomutase-like phosphatase (HAD superfamily)
MNTHPEALISDADGTLVDTVRLIRHGQYETARRFLVQHGIPDEEVPDYESYNKILTNVVGGSAYDTLMRTTQAIYEHAPHHTEDMDFDELHNMLNPVQDELAPEYVKAYEGLSNFLHSLGRAGVSLAIFTSGTPHHIVRNFGIALPKLGMVDLYKDTTQDDKEKLSIFTEKFASYYQLPKFTVVTAEDTDKHKPDPASLLIAANRLGVDPSRAVVLGDHKVDMQAAQNAGVETRIGITHGFDDAATLRGSGATDIASNLDDVARHLETRGRVE